MNTNGIGTRMPTTSPAPARRAEDTLKIQFADSTSPGRARHWLAWVLEDARAPQETISTAVLVVSELVTNATIHADGPIHVSAQLLKTGVRLVVHDDAPLIQPEASDEELPEHGRGLLIVEALADLHIDTDAYGTTVTAVIELTGGAR